MRRSTTGGIIGKVYPLPPLIAVALIGFPFVFLLNRGFTKWFHWTAFLYLLTKSEFLQKFQTLIGLSICLGWYSTIAYDYLKYGNFMVILYENMPMTELMFEENTGRLNYNSALSLFAMFMCHVLDFLGHPLLTYYFWRKHRQTGGSFQDVLTWPVILSTYLFSRLWSLTHTQYNFGRPGLFYMGHDVYKVEHLDCWYPAYIAESLVYASVVIWKLVGENLSPVNCELQSKENKYDRKPRLLQSESTMSASSLTSVR